MRLTAAAALLGTAAATAGRRGGTIYAVGGNNLWGQGLGQEAPPTFVPVFLDAEAVDASETHWGCLRAGSALMIGGNSYGQLGDGSNQNRNSLVEVVGLTDSVQAISAGYEYSLFLLQDGGVMAAGKNNFAQLGDGTTQQRSSPVPVAIEGNVTAISAGKTHSVFLKADGTVWSGGLGWYGQLGHGEATKSSMTPMQMASITGVQAISAGNMHTLLLRENGEVWVTGDGSVGQLGLGDGVSSTMTPVANPHLPSSVQAVVAAEFSSFFLAGDGGVWASGWNENGMLGDGSTENRHLPVHVLGDVQGVSSLAQHTLFLRSDGSVYATGENEYGELGTQIYGSAVQPELAAIRNVTSVAAGHHFSLFLTGGGLELEESVGRPCLAGTPVNQTGSTLETGMQHEEQRSLPCGGVSFGAVDVKCFNGAVVVVDDHCVDSCATLLAPTLSPTPVHIPTAAPTPTPAVAPTPAPTDFAFCEPGGTALLNGTEVEVSLSMALEHQGQRSVACPAGLMGAVTLQCLDGSLDVVHHDCASRVLRPTGVPTSAPTLAPTSVPAETPTPAPTVAQTRVPTAAPTLAPTATPIGCDSADAGGLDALRVVDCPEGQVGALVMSCSAGGLLKVVDGGNRCTPACTASTSAPTPAPPRAIGCAPGGAVNVDGASVSLAVAVEHHGQRSVACPAGMLGAAILECWDGILEVVHHDCVANPAMALETTLQQPIESGSVTIILEVQDGFAVGDRIRIFGDGYSEVRTVVDIGSVLLDSPLQYSYQAGSAVQKELLLDMDSDLEEPSAAAGSLLAILAGALVFFIVCCMSYCALWFNAARRLRLDVAAAERRIKELEDILEKQRNSTVCVATELQEKLDERGPATASELSKGAPMGERPPPYEQKAVDQPPDFSMMYYHLAFETYPDVYKEKFTHAAIEPTSTLLPCSFGEPPEKITSL